jgi:hypothetical protein
MKRLRLDLWWARTASLERPFIVMRKSTFVGLEKKECDACCCVALFLSERARLLDPVDDAFVREIVADRDGIANVLEHLLQARPIRINDEEFPLAAAVRQE